MVNSLLQCYIKLTEFLGLALGPDYEIVLYSLSDKNRSVIAIANNHISGQKIGDPMTGAVLRILTEKAYKQEDFFLHYSGDSINGKELRSSAMFIRQDEHIIGMLCVSFDDSRYQTVIEQILGLCHPDQFVEKLIQPEKDPSFSLGSSEPETLRNSTATVALESISRALERFGVPAERLTADERMQIIAELEADGIFMRKGAVKDVATGLQCSQASVYRYLARIKN